MKMKKTEFNSFLQNKKINQDIKDIHFDIKRDKCKSENESDQYLDNSMKNSVENRIGLEVNNINNLYGSESKKDVTEDKFVSYIQSQNVLFSSTENNNYENCLSISPIKIPYKSTCLALLIGIGADEQMVKNS